MEKTGAVRCDRCGAPLSRRLPAALAGVGARTLCLGCAHPAYRGHQGSASRDDDAS